MKLNVQTDYSLRLLMFLATKEGGTATIQEASSRMGLSQTHMMRVAAKLVAKGFLASSRGRLGGISLAKDASAITVEHVIRAVEPDFALVECFAKSKNFCSIEPACLLKGVLSSALEAFFSELRTVNLAQLTQRNHAELTAIFRLDDPSWQPIAGRVRTTMASRRSAASGAH